MLKGELRLFPKLSSEKELEIVKDLTRRGIDYIDNGFIDIGFQDKGSET